MTIKENGFIEVAFNFCENDGAKFLDFDDLTLGSLDFELFDPFSDVICGFFEKTVSLPIWIEVSG
jgi:hypothetical protein